MKKKTILGIVLLSIAGLLVLSMAILYEVDYPLFWDIFGGLASFVSGIFNCVLILFPILAILVTTGVVLILNARKKKQKASSTVCPSCHKANKDGTSFCVYCGTSLKTKKCPSCGKENESDALYCSHCGKELDK